MRRCRCLLSGIGIDSCFENRFIINTALGAYNVSGVILFIMYVLRLKSLLAYATAAVLSIFLVYILCADYGAAENDENRGVALPILMYHSICDSDGKAGKFVINKQELERDLKFLSENNYTAISFAELLDFTENGTPLPEKPIMLTFDDGYFNNYCYAYPLLKQYNFKAIISIIGRYTDLYSENTEENPNYSHITWTQAREMCDSGLVEIENHSYDSHTTGKGRNGTKKKKNESMTAYSEYIYSDVGKLQNEIEQNLGYTPAVFAYPFGSVSEASYDILKNMGFKATLSCAEKVNYVNVGDGDGLYMLGRYLRTNTKSAEAILKKACPDNN